MKTKQNKTTPESDLQQGDLVTWTPSTGEIFVVLATNKKNSKYKKIQSITTTREYDVYPSVLQLVHRRPPQSRFDYKRDFLDVVSPLIGGEQNLPGGYLTTRAWNPTYQHHHSPPWFAKILRPWAIKKGNYIAGTPNCCMGHYLPDFFDHWGSFKIGDKYHILSQPYGRVHSDVYTFAEEIGCDVVIDPERAPYAQGVKSKVDMYIFSQRE